MESINKKRYFFILFSFFAPFFILAGFFVWVSVVKAETNHVVISEILFDADGSDDGKEFIELYNPTDQTFDLSVWSVQHQSAGGSLTKKNFEAGDAVAPKSFFLIWLGNESRANLAWSSGSLNNTSATIYLVDNTNFISINSPVSVDSVKYDISQFSGFSAGQSLERKAWKNNACISAQGDNELLGNGCDNNDLNDFEIRIIPDPQNSQSPAEPAADTSGNTNSETAPVSASGGNNSSPAPAPVSVNQANPPSAEAGADKIAVAGEVIDFDGSDSFDPGGKELSYSWSFGDGENGKGENVERAYNSAGEYQVVLKVSNGTASGEDSLKVKVSEPEFSDKVILSEILPDPKGLDKDGEWIELANIGDKRVNLHGWILDDKVGGGNKPYALGKDIFIEPQGFLVVKRQESGLVLPNKGGELNLLWYDGKNLSRVSYGQSKEGQSYSLINGAWQWTGNLTPGKENVGAPPAVSSAKKSSATASTGDKNAKSSLIETGAAAQNSADENNTNDNDANTQLVSGVDEIAVLKENTISSVSVGSENRSFADNGSETKSSDLVAGELGAIPGLEDSGNQPQENNNKTKNNPWFWGDMALSILSLFLVWRYQEVKKRIR